LTKAQIDRLGELLREGNTTRETLDALEQYRTLFRPADEGAALLISGLGFRRLEISRRAGKSTPSIIAKLRRESTRLSQIQDIAGCRVIVEYLSQQDEFSRRLFRKAPNARIRDRRANPSYGYRAVHIILSVAGLPYEVQVRTYAQDLWAQLVEKLSDSAYPELKYGKGPPELLHEIYELSELELRFDQHKDTLAKLERESSGAKSSSYRIVTPAMIAREQKAYDRLAKILDDRFEQLGGR
jgi:ppGpp synthetase/RelA/SpoT-type nucleotidyltranferase